MGKELEGRASRRWTSPRSRGLSLFIVAAIVSTVLLLSVGLLAGAQSPVPAQSQTPARASASAPSQSSSFSFGLHVREPTGVLPFHAVWAAETGAEAVPVVFHWAEAEPSPGRFALQSQAAFISALRARGFHVVGVLRYPEHLPLATAPSSRSDWPTGHVDDWTFFVSQIVTRFRNDVDAWVIDGRRDEPVVDLFRAAEAERYAAFVRITASAVRRHEPRKLLLATAPGRDPVWMGLFGQFGGLAAVDGLAVDVNRWPTPPSGAGVTLQQLQAAARLHGERPLLWVWDFGYPTHRGISVGTPPRRGVTEEQQAAWLVQSHVTMLAAGAGAVFFSELFDQGPQPDDAADNFGLIRWNMEHKPAFAAYEAMTNFLRGLRPARAGDVLRRPELPGTGPAPAGDPSAGEGAKDEVAGDLDLTDDNAAVDLRSADFVLDSADPHLDSAASNLDSADPHPHSTASNLDSTDPHLHSTASNLDSTDPHLHSTASNLDSTDLAIGAPGPAIGATDPTMHSADPENDSASFDRGLDLTGDATSSFATESDTDANGALPYHFVFDNSMLHDAAGDEAVAAYVFTGERATIIVLWSEPAVAGGCRDGCGHVNVLQWLDGAPVRAYDVFGDPILDQNEWRPGSGPVYLELPMEMVP